MKSNNKNYRLYSEEEYTALEKYSTPELQRVPLDSLLLQMIAMGLPDPRKFPFVESPQAESIENSILSLKEHVSIINVLSSSNITHLPSCYSFVFIMALKYVFYNLF